MKSRTKRQFDPALRDGKSRSLVPRSWLGKRTPFVLALVYGIVLLAVGFGFHKIGDYGVETDFYWVYAQNAKEILSGGLVINPFKGPGYDLILAVVGALTQEFFRAGILISAVSGALVLLLTFKTVVTLYSAERAFLVTLALATNYTFVKCSYTASTDMFFNLLAALTLYLMVRSDDFKLWEFIAAGALTGFAYITRYNGVSFYVAALAGIFLLNYKRIEWRQRFAAAGAFIAGSLVSVIPWGLYCLKEKGVFFYNLNYSNIAYEMFAKGRTGWDQYWNEIAPRFNSYFDVVAYDPAAFFKQVGTNLFSHFWLDVSQLVGLPLGIFAFGGLAALIAQGLNRKQAMFFVFSATFYLVLLPVFYGERFSLYLTPTIILLSVAFFQWRRIPTLGFPRFGLIHVFLFGAIVVSAYASVGRVREDIDSGPAEILAVRDEFFRHPENPTGGKTIVARKPQIAYYLNMRFVPFPYVETLEELVSECHKAGADYLFYSSIEAGMRPQFRYLLDPKRAPPAFRPIVLVAYPPAVLYELKRTH